MVAQGLCSPLAALGVFDQCMRHSELQICCNKIVGQESVSWVSVQQKTDCLWRPLLIFCCDFYLAFVPKRRQFVALKRYLIVSMSPLTHHQGRRRRFYQENLLLRNKTLRHGFSACPLVWARISTRSVSSRTINEDRFVIVIYISAMILSL